MLKCGTVFMLVGSLMLSACGSLPSLEGRSTSQALLTHEGADTRLGQGLKPLVAQNPGLSGVVTLPNALDAFASRMLLISAAQRTIDIQYYIWRDDITGNMMLRALHEAAKRKVRVRLLLDDNGIHGLDDKLALLNAHPHIEVRLFNPFKQRSFKPLGFVTEFSRLNRRMHNKSMTIDGQVTVVGGRNIGDEYFGATHGVEFTDLDVLVAGKVVDEVSQDFDLYWHSQSAYPIEGLVPAFDKAATHLSIEQTTPSLHQDAIRYLQAIARSRFIERLYTGQLAFEWVPVRMVSDDPKKALGDAPQEGLLLHRLSQILGHPQHSIDLISPYFVPTQEGIEAFRALSQRGVKVRILTNALEATDVTAVHAGYAKYRQPLLDMGVTLFEMKSQGELQAAKERAGPFGSSGSSLHAKTFAVDLARVFVGSFNFDPRSAKLNTELGFLIESPSLAQQMSTAFATHIPRLSYQLSQDTQGQLVWIEQTPQGPKHFQQEPGSSWWRTWVVNFLSLLPIEPLI